jgi:hypothetical protein
MSKDYKPEELAARVFWLAAAGICAQIAVIALFII